MECGQLVWLRCRRNRCSFCGPLNARSLALAIAYARPERSYLLTLAGPSWEVLRPKVFRLRYRVREMAPGWSDCYHVEANPSGDGEHHVHGLAHGAYVPVEAFRRAAVREGFAPWVGLRRIRSQERAAAYGLKLASLAASSYSLKGVEQLEPFLRANGGRMVHASRRFWRHPDGVVIRGHNPMRTAMVAAHQAVQGDRAGCVDGRAHRWSPYGR